MKVAITNAEPLYRHQRIAIGEAFHCPVRETYGMAEIVTAASECSASRLHLWPEVGITEMVGDTEGTEPGYREGELVCTSLLNSDMPLIRYRVGDRARVEVNPKPCPCGRTLPTICSIEGRLDDAVYTREGRRIGRLDPVFKEHMPIQEAQIIQERLDLFRIRIVPAPGFGPSTEEDLRARLQARVGNVSVIFEKLERIPRTANGKFVAVVSRVTNYSIRNHE